MEIFYDDLQEGMWFKSLSPFLRDATLTPITGATNTNIESVLAYDRPDIVLTDNDHPILVVERTVEVPSGHNVGQRYARLAAAAQNQIPLVYFGPYAAYKHGGETQGPRYMNLRLFYALDAMARIESVSITTINWPVDDNYEIIQTSSKDTRIKAYLELFFGFYQRGGVAQVNSQMPASRFFTEQIQERNNFISTQVKKPEQYDIPPDSVQIGQNSSFPALRGLTLPLRESVVYNIGMKYIRSDPYTGTAMLYEYLYADGFSRHSKNMVLYFPNISMQMWRDAASSGRTRKDIRLYKAVSDVIIFRDGVLLKAAL